MKSECGAIGLIENPVALQRLMIPTIFNADLVFCPNIRKHLETVTRVDVVWDAYTDNSLNAAIRSKRGKGICSRVQGQNKIPQNLQSFLRDDDNTKELSSFLSRQLAQQNFEEKVVVATNAQDFLCYPPRDNLSSLAPCSHEDAYTRIMVHVSDALKHGLKRVMIRTVDTIRYSMT
ncbi:unnamed protein product [Mytilus coruscus]|uniref:Uncharacterized protein n=1 Tax=Mytilus coruscus TaxID=42192 RepID=A0A6J8A650_MYTCO|nr:unnamed protein product [Mytilus coruscus]